MKRNLFAVAGLLALTAAIVAVVYTYMKHRLLHECKVCNENIIQISYAIEAYSNEHRLYPKKLSELMPHYLLEIPTCPAAQADTYSIGYERGTRPTIQGQERISSQDTYTVMCSGNHHEGAGLPTPAWGTYLNRCMLP